MIVPICPICGHEMYFAGYTGYREDTDAVSLKIFMCIHCDHTESMIYKENEDQEFVL